MNRIQSDINLWRHNPEQLWTLGGLFCPLQFTNCNYMHWKELKLEIWQSSSNCILMSTQDTDTASLTWVTWNGVDKMGYNLQFIVKSMITYRHCSCTEDYMCSRHIHARPCVQTQVGTITETLKHFLKNTQGLYSHGPQKQNNIMFWLWFQEMNAAQKVWVDLSTKGTTCSIFKHQQSKYIIVKLIML